MFGRRRARRADPTAVEEAREHIRQLVLPGFLPLPDAKLAIAEMLEGSTSLDEDQLAALVDDVWTARLEEQASWRGEGDHDRVAGAFADLAAAGFVARMNFTCCQSCGHAEIRDEAGPADTAYVFFHQQDAERLADDDAELHLAYGVLPAHPAIDQAMFARAVDGDDEARAAMGPMLAGLEETIALQVMAAMERRGLTVSRRDSTARPAVRITAWRRRLPV
jgi:hypothetical protein